MGAKTQARNLARSYDESSLCYDDGSKLATHRSARKVLRTQRFFTALSLAPEIWEALGHSFFSRSTTKG